MHNMKACKRIILVCSLALTALSGLRASSSPDYLEAFIKGNDFYAHEEYASAIEQYQSALQSGYESWEVFFNIGNAYYRSGNYPQAILYYERAAKHSHGQPVIENNLRLAETKIVDRFDQMPQFFLTSWWNALVDFFSSTTWGIVCLCLFLLFLGSLALYILSHGYRWKKFGFYALLLNFILLATSTAAAIDSYRQFQKEYAIVMQVSVDAKVSPDERSQTKFILHEGSKVLVEDHVGSFRKVRIKNGSRAWVPMDCLTEI